MKIIFSSIICILTLQSLAHEDWSLKDFTVESTQSAEFIKHEGAEPFLALNLNADGFKQVFEKLDRYTYRPIKKPESNQILVITDAEYKDDISKFLSIQELNEIALKLDIQQSSYKPLCLGKGIANIENKFLESYFMAVESESLLNIRKEVARVYKEKGGQKFDPLSFSPYINLGFTDRELTAADGIVKDAKHCMVTLHISPKPSLVKGLKVANASYVDKNSKGGALIRGNAPINHINLEAMKAFGISEYVIFKNDKSGEVRGEMAGLRFLGFKDENINHINFDWKDNQDFSSGCKKIVQGIYLMKATMKNNKKLFFHCTTGEDRTGVLAGSYLLSKKNGPNIKKIFKTEMCAKGFEAGDPDKEKKIVEQIRGGLTKTFLKTAYRIEEAKKAKRNIDEGICLLDPSEEPAFKKYSTQMDFICGEAEKK